MMSTEAILWCWEGNGSLRKISSTHTVIQPNQNNEENAKGS